MKPRTSRNAGSSGFALVVTLSLMILLTVVAVGLLTLSSISLRSASSQKNIDLARSNARLALMLAIGELQKSAGDDRRITADGSIYADAAQPNAVGVWKSWSPKRIENPTLTTTNYTDPKTTDTGFVSWLVSSNDFTALQKPDWAKAGALTNSMDLFTLERDGFELAGSTIEVMKGTNNPGAYAWAVSQAATKAKITVAGPEENDLVANDSLQAQPRPSLALGTTFKNPERGWNVRANRVISMSQTELDEELWNGDSSITGGANFTTQGFGVLADVVNGGLKTDLSLGFEMSDTSFKQNSWSGVKNPFRYASAPLLGSYSNYDGERPLFRPLTPSGTVNANLSFPPANVLFEFPAAAVPTFTTLRSYYRTPYYLYNTADGPAVFERGADHTALTPRIPNVSSDPFSPPPAIPPGVKTQTSYRPVLDRILFVLSAGLGPDRRPRLVITPIVTLWNPYNTALDIEGAVAYPWIDVPFHIDWAFENAAGGAVDKPNTFMSGLMGQQFKDQNHGRSVNPFFYAAITSNGQPGATTPIRFQPGEVRVFAPTVPRTTEFNVAGSIRERTVFMRPVTSPNDLSARGGLAVPMYNSTRNIGFQREMLSTEKVRVTFKPSAGDYPFFIALEDATRAKIANPSHSNRGQVIGDVQTLSFSTDSSLVPPITSPLYTYAQLTVEPQPFGVIETYHRTALNTPSAQSADLLFTNNPRQPFINRYVAQGTFKVGPHYETRMRSISSLNSLIESIDGRSYYGPSNNSQTGKTHLSFFEVPRAPMLSLAGFQHSDLSTSAFATANQFGNSWASAYLSRRKTAQLTSANGVINLPVFDHAYLTNEALWDSFFFSGAAPTLQSGSSTGSAKIWDNPNGVASVTQSLSDTISSFVENPTESPLRNPRMRLHRGRSGNAEIISELNSPAGCTKIAAHLLVDGAFNVNSTNVDAWAAFLGGMRGKTFDVTGGTSPGGSSTSFPRFRNPIGRNNDNWQGFRSLSDTEINTLAANIVTQVRLRGPFLSLSEFVNRRLEDSALGLKGALQTAIDSSNLNGSAMMQQFNPVNYPAEGKPNIVPANTGVGIPGYLTQADLLQSIAPVITARSDTFTIRAYGDARDKAGKIAATAWCEAVVQRNPEFVDETNPASTALAEASTINQTFGRSFSIVSFRYLSAFEVGL